MSLVIYYCFFKKHNTVRQNCNFSFFFDKEGCVMRDRQQKNDMLN